MSILTGIIGMVAAIFAAIPFLFKWFQPKPPIATQQDDLSQVRNDIDNFKKTGRPQ